MSNYPGHDENKAEVHELILNAHDELKSSKMRALYLDGRELKSTEAFIEYGFKKANLHIVDNDECVVRKAAVKGINARLMPCETFAAKSAKTSYSLMYLDFMGSPYGSDDRAPMYCIERMLMRNKTPSVFAVTFCLRTGTKKNSSTAHADTIKNLENGVFRAANVSAESLFQKHYRNSNGRVKMCTYAYKIKPNVTSDKKPEYVYVRNKKPNNYKIRMGFLRK